MSTDKEILKAKRKRELKILIPAFIIAIIFIAIVGNNAVKDVKADKVYKDKSIEASLDWVSKHTGEESVFNNREIDSGLYVITSDDRVFHVAVASNPSEVDLVIHQDIIIYKKD